MTSPRDSLEMTSMSEMKTKEGGFILMGDPGDAEEGNLVPSKQPPNLYPLRMLWDHRRHVYYILYNDLRLVKMFRHVFRRDIEDSLILAKLWTCDVVDIEADDSNLLFLCQEWAISRYPRSNFDQSNVSLSDETANDSSSSSSETTPRKSFDAKLKHFITKVDKRSLTVTGQIEIPAAFYEQPEAYSKPWHMAASGNDLILYVENGDFVYHFEGGEFRQELSADHFHKKLTTSITGFKLRESLLYVGTDDNVLSVYNWKDLNCKVIIKIPDAENGNFALMGKSLTVTISKQKFPLDGDENCGSDDNSKNRIVRRSEIKHLRFVDVGTKDTFRKPVSLKDFKIVTSASNGKLVLYKSLNNELVYQNI